MYFSYYGSNGAWYDKADLIARFDANLDGAISRLDGTSGSSSLGEACSFGATGLTLAFDDARLTLQGADCLI